MLTIPPLETFGPRICVFGPSNAGKSTLTVALAAKTGARPVHLDQYRFLPDTDWQERPDDEFAQLHDEAIAGESWIIDGGYSSLLPGRLQRATGLLLLGDNRWSNLRRYFYRTLLQRNRAGNLAGNKDSIKWEMLRWIMVGGPQSLARYEAKLPAIGLPFHYARSMHEVNRLYETWGLPRP
ncbi:MAG TPA: AAA family ATPase [Devosiaceae bacterium]|jgi:adenylate kinase family enzyme